MPSFNTLINEAVNVRFFSDPIDFGLYLAGLKGHQFLSFDASYDMDAKGKMLVKSRVDKTPNPYRGVGLRKIATTEATVCFDYKEKVERRGGEEPEKEGNWMQAVVIKGKLTPLSTHKGDIKTEPKPGAVANAKGEYAYSDLQAVMDADGSVQFTVEEPRLYLRYEIVCKANPEATSRTELEMKSHSEYVLGDGGKVDKKTLEPYLPASAPRTDETTMQCTALDNVVELRAAGTVWRRRTVGLKLPSAVPSLV